MINQINPFGSVFPVLTLIVVLLFLGLIVRIISVKAAADAKIKASPILDEPAHMVTKRCLVTGQNNMIVNYYATFEFQNGVRTEFSVKAEEYGLLAEGDRGTLRFQGPRYLSFKRT